MYELKMNVADRDNYLSQIEQQIKMKRRLLLEKRKNDKKNYYLVVTVLLTVIAICLLQGAMKNNIDVDNSPSRALYENFNVGEIEEYEHNNMLGDDLTSSNHYLDKIKLYYNETDFINYEESHDVDKYKKSYYKLLKVCIPQLRRGHA